MKPSAVMFGAGVKSAASTELGNKILPLALCFLAACAAWPEGVAAAEEPSPPPVGASPSAPRAPIDPASAELARALRDARKEHETLRAQVELEARQEAAKVAEETKAALSMREEERKARERLKALETETQALDEKLSLASRDVRAAVETLKDLEAEIVAQAVSFRERFTASLAALEDPRLLEGAAEAAGAAQPLGDRLHALLDVYERVLIFAQTAGVLQLPLRVTDAGKVEKLYVLRLGLLGGYYSRPGQKEGGLVLCSPDSPGAYVAESRGLTEAQKARIAAVVERPEKAGLLPCDVTGGAGLAALSAAAEPWWSWNRLQRGGLAMWGLAALALISLIIIVERAVVLGARTFGLGGKIEGILTLIRSGRLDSAEAICSRSGGPVGAVMGAALGHRREGAAVLQGAVEEALSRSSRTLFARLRLLSLCAALAPLLGLLGTVAALSGAFNVLSAIGAPDSRFLVGGVSEALTAIEVGIAIAVPCLLFRGLFAAQAESALGKLETGALAALTALAVQKETPVEVGEAR